MTALSQPTILPMPADTTLYDLTLERYERDARRRRRRITGVVAGFVLGAAIACILVFGAFGSTVHSQPSAVTTPDYGAIPHHFGPTTMGFGGVLGRYGCREVNTTGSDWQRGDADGGMVCDWASNSEWAAILAPGGS